VVNDIAIYGVAVSLISISIAVIKSSKNGCYVKKDACHSAMESQDKRIDDLKAYIADRFDDIKALISK